MQVASGSFQTQLNSFTHSTLVVREVPFLYTQLESTLRQLRISHHDNHQEGQYHIFHTLEELEERLKVPLAQLKVTSADFKSAITFIHKVRGDTLKYVLSWVRHLVDIWHCNSGGASCKNFKVLPMKTTGGGGGGGGGECGVMSMHISATFSKVDGGKGKFLP